MAQTPVQKFQVETDIPVKRNVVINGNFNIWQRGFTHTGLITSSAHYTADRWILQLNTHGTWTVQQITDGPTSQFQKCAECLVTTADAVTGASDAAAYVQRIEGFNILALYQVPFTISFWVKSNVIGPYYFAVDNGFGLDRSYVIPYTINVANTWEYKTLFVTSSPVGGTWNFTNSIGMQMQWSLGQGTDFHTTTFNAWVNNGAADCGSDQVNVAAAINNYWRITGVQVEPGLTATPFEVRPFSEELILCQRYYEKSYDVDTVPGTITNNGLQHQFDNDGALSFYVHYSVSKRSVGPTVTVYSPTTGSSGVFRSVPPDANVGIGLISSFGHTGFHTGAVAVADPSNNYVQWVSDAEL